MNVSENNVKTEEMLPKKMSIDEVKMASMALGIFAVLMVTLIGGFYLVSGFDKNPDISQAEQINLSGDNVMGANTAQTNSINPNLTNQKMVPTLKTLKGEKITPTTPISPTLLPSKTPTPLPTVRPQSTSAPTSKPSPTRVPNPTATQQPPPTLIPTRTPTPTMIIIPTATASATISPTQ